MNNIYIFTIKDCDYCISLKNKLNESDIPFIDLPIHENPVIWDKVKILTGYDYIPTILIQDNNNPPQIFIPERDYTSEDEIIKLIKSYV